MDLGIGLTIADLDLECEYKLTTHRRGRKSGSVPRDGCSDSAEPANLSDLDRPKKKHAAGSSTAKRQRTAVSVSQTTDEFSPQGIMVQPPQDRSVPNTTIRSNGSSKLPNSPLPQLSQDPHQTWLQQGPIHRDMSRLEKYERSYLPEPLPRHKLLIELCQIYFTRLYGQVYAFLHPPSFMQAVVEDVHSLNPALLLAICAISSRFMTHAIEGEMTPDLWASTCVDMVFGVTSNGRYSELTTMMARDENSGSADNLGKPSVTCVQALSTISFFYFGEGQSSMAWVMSGFAVRMAHALHLNEEFYEDPIGLPQNQPAGFTVTFKDREIRRRTFWALFVMDRLNSAGEHRPFTIKNDEMKIQLPVAQALFDRESPALTCSLDGLGLRCQGAQDPSANMDCMAWLIKIMDIWGEVSCFVHLPADPLQWAADSPFMLLRSKAFRWAESLPCHMRYDDSDSRHQPAGWYIMHAAYHLSLCIMHRFALPKPASKQQYSIDHIPVQYLTMCVKESIHNAIRVSELLQRIPPSTKVTAPFVGFAAFSAATLHAFLGFHVVDFDNASAEIHRSFVHSTLTYLRDLGTAWKPLSMMHEALTAQIINRPRSARSHNSSILHETVGTSGQEQFRVPDSMHVQFSNQQQIELNTMAFSNWFNNPTTQSFFDPSWSSPGPGMSYPNSTGLLPYNNPQFVAGPASPLNSTNNLPIVPPPLQSQPPPVEQIHKRPKPSDAPYGDAFPIVDTGEDDDAVAADLLVSFKQEASQFPKPAPSKPGSGGTSINEPAHPRVGSRSHDAYIDRLGNLRDSTGIGCGPVDILQLMKVGLITSQHWT